MSSVTLYRSSDTGAPTLTGTAGDLINLLNKCLVTGYGSLAGAGWTMPYDNGATPKTQAVFRPGSGVQHYFHVDDNSPNATAVAREAQLRGSETATAVLTGTNFFPTTSQVAAGAGMAMRKSASADATARSWILVADDRTCYLFMAAGDTPTYRANYFGEIYSLDGTDAYRSIVTGIASGNSTSSTGNGDQTALGIVTGFAVSGVSNRYICRTFGGAQPPPLIGSQSLMGQGSPITVSGWNAATAVDPGTGAVYLVPLNVAEAGTNSHRGRYRGLYGVNLVSSAVTDGDTIAGSGAYAGRTFRIIKTLWAQSGGSSNSTYLAVDVTGPWESN